MTEPSSEQQAIIRTWEAWDAAFGGDDRGFLEGIDTEVEWIPLMAVLEGRVFNGHQGLRDWLEELRRDWEAFEPTFEEFRDLGNGRVLVLGYWRARARSSGVELKEPASWLMRLRDGKVARLQTFTDREEAIAVAERLRTTGGA